MYVDGCMHSYVQLFVIPCTAAHQAPLSTEFSRQEYWSGVPSPLPGDLPDPGIKSESPASPALAHYPVPPGSPKCDPAAAAKPLQSCPTPCDPVDGSPPGSAVPGILQARTLEWVAISFSKNVTLGITKSYSSKIQFSH